MVTGTVGGAARLLNVSSPGISRVMKHAELSVGVKLFNRRGGRYTPTREANAIFNQINNVYNKVEDLQFVISRIKRGADTELKVASVPSIAAAMVPKAVADVRRHFPNILIDVDILKIEEAADYLLLGRGELVALSSKFDHPMLTFEPLALGRLRCLVPEGHGPGRIFHPQGIARGRRDGSPHRTERKTSPADIGLRNRPGAGADENRGHGAKNPCRSAHRAAFPRRWPCAGGSDMSQRRMLVGLIGANIMAWPG